MQILTNGDIDGSIGVSRWAGAVRPEEHSRRVHLLPAMERCSVLRYKCNVARPSGIDTLASVKRQTHRRRGMQGCSTNSGSITEWNMDTRQNRRRACVRILSVNRSLGVNSEAGKTVDLGRVLARGVVAPFRVNRQFGGRAFLGLVPCAARRNAAQRTGRSDRAAGGRWLAFAEKGPKGTGRRR